MLRPLPPSPTSSATAPPSLPLWLPLLTLLPPDTPTPFHPT